MNKEVIQRIDKLAESLKTTGEHLWEVATRQGMVEGIANLLLSAVLLLVAVATACLFYVSINKFFFGAAKDANEFWVIASFLSGLATLIFGTVGLSYLHEGITLYLNPEGYALKLILGQLH